MICPLCNKNVKELHKRSHILPDNVYQKIYNKNPSKEKPRLSEINFQNKKSIKAQTGFYGKIMCSECERKSQNYDDYFHKLLKDKNIKEYTKYSEILNFNFKKTQKYIVLCILREHLYQKKLLNKNYFNRLKNLYLNDINDDETFPIIIIRILKNNDLFKYGICPPYWDRIGDHRVIRFSHDGFDFVTFISSHKKTLWVKNIRLKKDQFIMINIKNRTDTRSFKKILKTASKIIKK